MKTSLMNKGDDLIGRIGDDFLEEAVFYLIFAVLVLMGASREPVQRVLSD